MSTDEAVPADGIDQLLPSSSVSDPTTASESPSRTGGLWRTVLAGPGHTLKEAFANLEQSSQVERLVRHAQRDLLGARVTLTPEEGEGYWELTRIRDDFYVITLNFLYKNRRFELGESEPGLFAKYLSDSERADEAITFAKSHLSRVTIQEQPVLLNYWANAITIKGEPNANAEALPLYREAIRLKPDYWVGYNNLMLVLSNLGEFEEVIRLGDQMMKAAGGRPGKAPEAMYQNYDDLIFDFQKEREGDLADMVGTGRGTTTTQSGAEGLTLALVDVELHDIEAARLHLKTTVWDEKSPPDVAQAALAGASLDEEMGELTEAVRVWDTFVKAFTNPDVSTANTSNICRAAVAYEMTGQSQKADAALAAVGTLPFPDCYRFKGDVLDLRGRWDDAQTWYQKAISLAPSYPAAYYAWGVALAKHGDLDGAAAKFKDANKKGPHWADPLKAWGDALEKYDEALKYAPKWKQLKEAREAAKQKRAD